MPTVAASNPTAGGRTVPNVVLIHCHDLGRQLNCYGAGTVSSPNLDGFAADGVLAEQMFTCAPQCSPSRAGLFTGRWPHANGVLGLTHKNFGWDLHPDEKHLARRLGDAGVATELIGVHHESRVRPDDELATALGFDRVRTGGLVHDVVARGTEAIGRLGAGDRPFFLEIGFVEPHRMKSSAEPGDVMGFLGDHLQPDSSRGVDVPPYLTDTDESRAEIAELQGAIKAVDGGVGELLAALDSSGLAENTITIFTTDHGLALPRAKCNLYDPGMEVAFVVRWPAGGWTGGVRLDDLLVNLDVVPTLLGALGIEAGDGPPLHGRSFLPLLQGRPDELDDRAEIFGEISYHDYYDPRRSVRTPEHKLIVNFSSSPLYMDASQSWRRRCVPVGHPNGNTGSHPVIELYDLAADPLEFSNLADDPEYAEIQQRLLATLQRWMRETGDPLLDGAVTSPQHTDAVTVLGPAD